VRKRVYAITDRERKNSARAHSRQEKGKSRKERVSERRRRRRKERKRQHVLKEPHINNTSYSSKI
jgi:hypothetical protein